jgi:uncharacterized protein with FMN-binding domain
MTNMKKFLLAGFIILTFGIYAFMQKQNGQTAATVPASTSGSSESSSSSAATSSSASSGGTATAGNYKNGTYTGTAADAVYGNIQVKATIAGGKITDVQFLQYPNDQHESVEINAEAMPQLRQEAIQAQTANVDIVSGATDTSRAFRQSLSAALSSAQAS